VKRSCYSRPSRRTLGREYDPVRVKEEEQIEAIENERFFSNPPADVGLSGPAVLPALPPIPTATVMARQAREDREYAELARLDRHIELLKAIKSRNAPVTKHLENTLVPTANQPESSTPPPPEAAR